MLNNINYHSPEMNRKYISVSQYKNFMGTIGRLACEEQAMAILNEKWQTEKTTSLLVGSYVDAKYEGTLETFIAENPDLFTQKKELRAEYKKANEIIARCERDELFTSYMSGEKQVIMTAEMFGANWKIKIDSYHPNVAIVDLKVMESLNKHFWTKDYGYMNFVHVWGYYIQGAVYREVVYLNDLAKCKTQAERDSCKRLPFYLATVSKEKEPDIEIIQLEPNLLDEVIREVEQNTPKILMLKNGEVEPIRCGICDWCKHTKVLTRPIWSSELLGEI